MGNVAEGLLKQIDALIAVGRRVDATFRSPRPGFAFTTSLPDAEVLAFVNSAAFLVEQTVGRDSELHRRLPEPPDKGLNVSHDKPMVSAALGVLVALKHAVETGLLVSLERRFTANVFDDFLEQAKALLDGDFHVAAAMVIVGGVLEDHLRKACISRRLEWNGDGSLSKYNDLLHHEKLYDKPTWRRIQVIGDVRNDAAHGHFDKVKKEDVVDALQYVARFLADHPS